MENKIWEIIKNCKSDSLFQTHVSLFSPKGKYSIPRHKIDNFWDVYSSIFEKNN